jgi:hypothetical protein
MGCKIHRTSDDAYFLELTLAAQEHVSSITALAKIFFDG